MAKKPVQPVQKTPLTGVDVDSGCEAVVVAMRAAGLRVEPLPRVDSAQPEDARAAVSERQGPLVFTGLTDDWRAITDWTPEKLIAQHGDKPVTALMNLPAGGILLPHDQKHYERTMLFGEFIREMLAASAESPCYLAYARMEELFPAEDTDFSSFRPGTEAGTDTRVWIGSKGTRSMFHSDLKDNFFCQVMGEKHVVLLPWAGSRSAYPFPDNLVNSRVDLAEPDVRRFPRLRDAVFYAGTLRPGDTLFMPRGCWHDIRSLSPSISVNHWFGPSLDVGDYVRLLARLGPAYWLPTARDFLWHGVLHRDEQTRFFFSPPSTGKRLYDWVRYRDFSRGNDPSAS